MIQIPIPKIDVREEASDSFEDFCIGMYQTLNFYHESLMLYSISKDSMLPKNVESKKGKTLFKEYEIPKMVIHSREADKFGTYPERLFYNAIVNVCSNYEIFLRFLAQEIYYYNPQTLETNERQLTTTDILTFETKDDIIEELVYRATTNMIMSKYPNLVNKFENNFHVGIHSKKAFLTLYEVHHFLEIRNIIVHNDGRVSKTFLERIKGYNQESPFGLKKELDSPALDFEYFESFCRKLIELGNYIDIEVNKKWKTSTSE